MQTGEPRRTAGMPRPPLRRSARASSIGGIFRPKHLDEAEAFKVDALPQGTDEQSSFWRSALGLFDSILGTVTLTRSEKTYVRTCQSGGDHDKVVQRRLEGR